GGSEAENDGNAVVWLADGQVASSAVITVQGKRPAFLDLNGHKAAVSKVFLSKSAKIQTGDGGVLRTRQLFVDGNRLKDGVYRVPESWIEGPGSVVVDARVEIKGTIGGPEVSIGAGNIGSLTGHTKIAYPSAGGDYDIATNGFALTLDSGDGNAFS